MADREGKDGAVATWHGRAVLSCHVEHVLDDAVWRRYVDFASSSPSGLPVASLLRAPHPEVEGRLDEWVERAHTASAFGPFGHHTHFGGPGTARPCPQGLAPAQRVEQEAEWLRDHRLAPRLWCGGGWYVDQDVLATVSRLGYTDVTATSFRHSYFPPEHEQATMDEPSRVAVSGAPDVIRIPTTHSLRLFWRAAIRGALPPFVHLYFHDYELADRRRRIALHAAVRWLDRAGAASVAPLPLLAEQMT
jgi:hypothetical protein